MDFSKCITGFGFTISWGLRSTKVWKWDKKKDKVLIDVFFKEVFVVILWLLSSIISLLLLLFSEKFGKINQIFEGRFISLFVLYYSSSTSLNNIIEKKASSLSQFIWLDWTILYAIKSQSLYWLRFS